ncbi:extensin-like [Canis lupus familiaris]|uniref:extensin-like n=1 Tax=Canis lupus familiaris TaxID=9615 RepID=UPI0018F44A0C|nr:uncharacterized protein LOC118353204 isoform X2 [Canis lupus dingo]XP_038438620.1 extensin-like [Canis lupus familiaris]
MRQAEAVERRGPARSRGRRTHTPHTPHTPRSRSVRPPPRRCQALAAPPASSTPRGARRYAPGGGGRPRSRALLHLWETGSHPPAGQIGAREEHFTDHYPRHSGLPAKCLQTPPPTPTPTPPGPAPTPTRRSGVSWLGPSSTQRNVPRYVNSGAHRSP